MDDTDVKHNHSLALLMTAALIAGDDDSTTAFNLELASMDRDELLNTIGSTVCSFATFLRATGMPDFVSVVMMREFALAFDADEDLQ